MSYKEYKVIQVSEGAISTLLFGGAKLPIEKIEKTLEDNLWSWASDLKNGEMILQSRSGQIMKGKPNRIGWDHLECISERSIEISESAWTKDGWWILDIDGDLVADGTDPTNWDTDGDWLNDFFEIDDDLLDGIRGNSGSPIRYDDRTT